MPNPYNQLHMSMDGGGSGGGGNPDVAAGGDLSGFGGGGGELSEKLFDPSNQGSGGSGSSSNSSSNPSPNLFTDPAAAGTQTPEGPAADQSPSQAEQLWNDLTLPVRDFLKQFFPWLKPLTTDTDQEKAKKQRQLQTIAQMNQEQMAIFQQKAAAWNQKKEQIRAEEEAKRQQKAAQEAATPLMPTGKKQGAQDLTGSRQQQTDQFMEQQRKSNSDRTQGAA